MRARSASQIASGSSLLRGNNLHPLVSHATPSLHRHFSLFGSGEHGPRVGASLARRIELLALWVIGKEVAYLDLPQAFARLRRSSRSGPFSAYLEAMSADTLLTPNARAGPAMTYEPGSDLRFYFVAGAGFEPATSGL